MVKVDITVDASGKFLAGYVKKCEGVVAETEQHRDGKIAIDFDANGRLLGIEFLAIPCEIKT